MAAANHPTYDQQGIEVKVRIDAVILEKFRTDPEFISTLRSEAKRLAPDDKSRGLKEIVQGMRDELSADLTRLPKASANGVDDKIDYGHQRVVIDSLIGQMGREKGELTPQYYMNRANEMSKGLTAYGTGGEKPHDLPHPVILKGSISGINLVKLGESNAEGFEHKHAPSVPDVRNNGQQGPRR